MHSKTAYDVYVGSKSGVFKGVKIGKNETVIDHLQNLVSITVNDEVSSVAWGNDEETEILIACGDKGDRSVKVYDTEDSTFTCAFSCNVGQGRINGISRYDDAILTAVHSGEIKQWKFDQDEVIINAGKNLNKMRHSKVNKRIIATGGEEHPLKLFDLETRTKTFTEKNLPHDFLQLRVPISISDIGFLPNSEQIVTAGKYGHVRLYDPNAQKRPVIKLEVKEEACTCLSILPREKQIVVGTGKGKMNLVDLRKPGRILNTYKGFTGSVSDVACCRSEPYIVSTSLDRFLRIHHIDTKQLVKKIYLKSRPTCMLLNSEFLLETKNEDEDDAKTLEGTNENYQGNDISKCKDAGELDSDEEYNKMFDKMPVIGDKKSKKIIKKKRKVSEVICPPEIDITPQNTSEKANKKSKLISSKMKTMKGTIKKSTSKKVKTKPASAINIESPVC